MPCITAYKFPEVFILKFALTIIQLVLAVILTGIIILQQGRQQGLGAISGAADTFFSKNKASSIDAILSKLTVVIATVFIILTLVLNLGFIG